MSIEFGRPEAFWLLLLIPIVILVSLRSRTFLPVMRRYVVLMLRILEIVALVTVVAQPQLLLPSDRVSTAFLVDVSDSIAPSARQQAIDWVRNALEEKRPNDRYAVIAFGKDAETEQGLTYDPVFSDIQAQVDGSQTDLASALRLAMATLPSDEGRRIVLLSDGNENIGRAQREALLAAASGTQISIVPISSLEGPEALVQMVEVPTNLHEKESFVVRATVASNINGQSKFTVLTDGQVTNEEVVNLSAGANQLTFNHEPIGPGFHSIKVAVAPDLDTLDQNNVGAAYTFVSGAPKTLLIEGSAGEGRYLAKAIEAAGIQTETRAANGLPGAITDLVSYDNVVLIDVPSAALAPEQMQALNDYVRDFGGGLVVIGGAQSYTVGGYAQTPLEEMLPVQIGVRGKKVSPSTALVLVIDKSGSMGMGVAGLTKMDLAKQAALKSAQVLGEQDQLGIVTFDEEADWTHETDFLTKPEDVKKAIASIQPGGGTSIFPALKRAYDSLVSREAKIKHIVLMTDGLSANADYDTLVRQMRDAQITLSAIAIGSDADVRLLRHLSSLGNGRYYDGNNPFDIPQLLVRETQEVAKAAIVEEQFTPDVASQNPILSGVPVESMPALRGYVATTIKPNAQAILMSPLDDPVLAEWQYGLGRVVAWTSDAQDRWSSNWLTWEGFSQFWSQLVKRTFPAQIDTSLQTQASIEGDQITLTVDSVTPDKAFRNFAKTTALVVNPKQEKQEVSLEQIGPGRYQGTAKAAGEGTYLIEVRQEDSNGSTIAGRPRGLVIPYSMEYADLGTRTDFLTSLAQITGGNLLANPGDAFTHDLRVAGERTPIWQYLLALAALLLLVDVAARRIRVPIRRLAEYINDTIGSRLPRRPTAAVRSRLIGTRLRPATSRVTLNITEVVRARPSRVADERPNLRHATSGIVESDSRTAEPASGSSRTSARLLGAKRRAAERQASSIRSGRD